MKQYTTIGPGTKISRLGGSPPRSVLVLLIIQVGFFIVYAFADGPSWVAQSLGASAGTSLAKLQFWQPLTALWLHLGSSGLLFNALTLWVFGSALVRWWGGRRFVFFWIVTGVVGLTVGVFFGLLQPKVVLSGSAGSSVGMLTAMAVIFPEHLVFFYGLLKLKVKILTLLLAIFMILGNVISGAYLIIAVQMGGAFAALLFFFSPRKLIGKARVKHAKRKFKVIEGGVKDKKKYWN